jgi:hypothetical protein
MCKHRGPFLGDPSGSSRLCGESVKASPRRRQVLKGTRTSMMQIPILEGSPDRAAHLTPRCPEWHEDKLFIRRSAGAADQFLPQSRSANQRIRAPEGRKNVRITCLLTSCHSCIVPMRCRDQRPLEAFFPPELNIFRGTGPPGRGVFWMSSTIACRISSNPRIHGKAARITVPMGVGTPANACRTH